MFKKIFNINSDTNFVLNISATQSYFLHNVNVYFFITNQRVGDSDNLANHENCICRVNCTPQSNSRVPSTYWKRTICVVFVNRPNDFFMYATKVTHVQWLHYSSIAYKNKTFKYDKKITYCQSWQKKKTKNQRGWLKVLVFHVIKMIVNSSEKHFFSCVFF